jgi:hypothetical protein
VVVDVKSGVLQGEASQEQRRQLLLYARLVEAAFGELPAELIVEDASGRRHPIAFTPADVSDAVSEVDQALGAFNRAVRGGQPLEYLARASASTCGFCSQRLACTPYWSALSTDWHHGSVLGRVEKVVASEVGYTAELTVRSPVDAAGRRAPVVRLSQPFREGSELAIVDCDVSADSGCYRARWDSRTVTGQDGGGAS